MRDCDVLVVGGGSAGFAAAVSAARAGARTLLVERDAVLGGMAPSALVHSICGLFPVHADHSAKCGGGLAGEAEQPRELRYSNPGFAEELARRLIAAGGAEGPVRLGRVEVLLQQPRALARLADVIARETANLEVLFHTDLVRIGADRSATLLCRGRSEEVQARAVVDASGDGCAAALLGAPFEQESAGRLQRPAFIFGLHGVAPGAADDDRRLKIAARVTAAVRDGRLPEGALGAALRGSCMEGEVYVTIDLAGSENYDPTDPSVLSQLAMEGRELAEQFAAFLQQEAGGFEESSIAIMPARIGVRESRRITGRCQLTACDLEQSAAFEDAVAAASWPMELRETNRGARLRFSRDSRACDIPLRALQFREHNGFFMAGRCISASHEAQASIRVIGTCLATGEAAGLAAAIYAWNGASDAGTVRALRARVRR